MLFAPVTVNTPPLATIVGKQKRSQQLNPPWLDNSAAKSSVTDGVGASLVRASTLCRGASKPERATTHQHSKLGISAQSHTVAVQPVLGISQRATQHRHYFTNSANTAEQPFSVSSSLPISFSDTSLEQHIQILSSSTQRGSEIET